MRKIRLDQGRMEATEEIEVVFDEGEESVINSEESNEVMASNYFYLDDINNYQENKKNILDAKWNNEDNIMKKSNIEKRIRYKISIIKWRD